jgi:translocation and assembly module TamB
MRFSLSRRGGPSRKSSRRGRPWRWTRRFLVCLAALAALIVVLALVVVHSLDQPWVKRRVQAAARASAGVDIDYGAVRVASFSGADIEGLVVHSPAELRPFADDLVRVGRVEARWSLGSLFGRGSAIQRLLVSDVALTVVVDEHGRTSFDALPKRESSSPTKAPVPLSRQASILEMVPPVGEIDVENITFALVRTTPVDGSSASAFS